MDNLNCNAIYELVLDNLMIGCRLKKEHKGKHEFIYVWGDIT